MNSDNANCSRRFWRKSVLENSLDCVGTMLGYFLVGFEMLFKSDVEHIRMFGYHRILDKIQMFFKLYLMMLGCLSDCSNSIVVGTH